MSEQTSKSSTFGIIALIISILLLFTPRFLVTIGLMAWAVFLVVGLVKDGNKIFSVISLFVGGLMLYFLMQEAVHSTDSYEVKYVVECDECSISYTNSTGGTDSVKDNFGTWETTINCQGDRFLNIQAQNDDNDEKVKVSIYVNGSMLKSETSSGEFSIASVYGRPEEIHTVRP